MQKLLTLGLLLAATSCGSSTEASGSSSPSAEHQALPAELAGIDQGDPTPHGKLPPEVLFEIALRHMNEGNFQGAIGHLTLAIEQDGQDPILFANRANCYQSLGQDAMALGDIEQALKLAPGDPALLTSRGQILRKFARDDDSMADFDAALAVAPDYYPALFNRGVLHANLGENQAALADFSAAIASQPETSGAYYNRAFVHEALGDLEAAKADMHAFLERTKQADYVELAKAHLATWESPNTSQDK